MECHAILKRAAGRICLIRSPNIVLGMARIGKDKARKTVLILTNDSVLLAVEQVESNVKLDRTESEKSE